MVRVRKVALLGNSVIASSVASTLRGRPELEVIQFGDPTSEASTPLCETHPDAIILCELPVSPNLIFLLLREYPGVPVIGADVGADRMVVLSGRQAILRTEDDLLEALRIAIETRYLATVNELKKEADSPVEGTPRQDLVEEKE